jgi:hypothetical protein
MMSKSPVLRADRNCVSAIARALVGSRIDSIEYRQTTHGGLLGVPVSDCHEIELDVLLHTSRGVVDLTWEREDLVEGLSISVMAEVSSPGDVVGVIVDRSPQWAPLKDGEILSVAFGWQVSELGCPESLWSLRLEFVGGANVIFALGVLDDASMPHYFPDSLLAIFDERTASSYTHAGAIGSAWALDIC